MVFGKLFSGLGGAASGAAAGSVFGPIGTGIGAVVGGLGGLGGSSSGGGGAGNMGGMAEAYIPKPITSRYTDSDPDKFLKHLQIMPLSPRLLPGLKKKSIKCSRLFKEVLY
jgi:hypothetical protein